MSEDADELEGLARRLHSLVGYQADESAGPGGPGAIERAVSLLEERMVSDRQRLTDNIESLERTNRELHEARDQVIRAARLASVGTLAAGIAHEVGNPLAAIMGFVDVARKRAERDGHDTELLDDIRGEAVRIDVIVRGLLDYSRPPTDGAEVRSAAEIIEKVREKLAHWPNLRVHWVAGHVGIEGNELADTLANAAVAGVTDVRWSTAS